MFRPVVIPREACMSALATPSSIYHLLLPHPHQAALLLIADQGSWALPTVTPSEPHFGVVAHLNQTVQTTFGLDVVTLCCLGDDWQPGAEMINSVYELENLTPDNRHPAGTRWVLQDEVADLRLGTPEHRPHLDDWFRERRDGRPATRRPWAQPGWFQDTCAWIEAQLELRGTILTGPIRQLRNWERSTLLEVPTGRGRLYYKAAPPPLAQEGTLLRWLAQHFPGEVAEVVALDEARGGFLMQDLQAVPLHDTRDLAQYEQAARRYGEMQRALVGQVPGLPDFTCTALADQVDWLLTTLAQRSISVGTHATWSACGFRAHT
ncbi:hypothetical protein [Deinococcus arcticus]|uniref:hypothetical protein n=1 Tax=Deinococcus arcticus TaxID=2136176 RepID=UPI0011B245F3|nr:hypothetical protein [Deinococcus arcticus]